MLSSCIAGNFLVNLKKSVSPQLEHHLLNRWKPLVNIKIGEPQLVGICFLSAFLRSFTRRVCCRPGGPGRRPGPRKAAEGKKARGRRVGRCLALPKKRAGLEAFFLLFS